MVGLIYWGGLKTGAYFIISSTNLDSGTLLKSYRKLVILEIVSLISIKISGLIMWSMLDYPTWVYPAFILAPVLAFGEYYHYKLTFHDLNTFRQKMKWI